MIIRRNYLLVLLLLSAPVPAGGEEPSPAAYRQLKESGRVSYKAGDYQTALKSYNNAYRLHNDPRMLYNIAQCHRHLGNTKRAIFFYEQHLKQWSSHYPDQPTPVKAKAKEHIAKLQAKLREEQEREHAGIPGNDETHPLGDEKIWTGVAEIEGSSDSLGTRDEGSAISEKHSNPDIRRTKTIWGATALGIGAACTITAAVLYGVGGSQGTAAYDEYQSATNTTDVGHYHDEVEAARTKLIAGHVLLGVAVAAFGVGIYQMLTRPEIPVEGSRTTPGFAPTHGGGAVTIKGRF